MKTPKEIDWEIIQDLRADKVKLEAERERLRDALYFYAVAWEGYVSLPGQKPQNCRPADALLEDKGERARAALKETGSE